MEGRYIDHVGGVRQGVFELVCKFLGVVENLVARARHDPTKLTCSGARAARAHIERRLLCQHGDHPLVCQHYVDSMKAESREFTTVADTLLTSLRYVLGSPDAKTRVRTIHHLAAGVEALERQVLLDAQSSGLTWAQIGEIYGVSRQAVHRRFSNETVVPSVFFDQLLVDLDEDTEAVPALAKAAKRIRRVTSA